MLTDRSQIDPKVESLISIPADENTDYTQHDSRKPFEHVDPKAQVPEINKLFFFVKNLY